MLTSLFYARSLKTIFPAVCMLGTAPTFLLGWFSWRVLSLPFPGRVYEKGDEIGYALYQRLVLFFYENWTGLQIILYGDYEDILNKKENIIFMSNHQSTVDWVIADMLAERQGCLGNIRYILKDGLKFFPLYGFYFRQHSCIYVKRSGKFKQDQATLQLQQIKSNKTPFWMVVFPEGTRFNPELSNVLEKSKQYAIDQGEKPYNEHLTPRMKALELSINELRESADAVYDVTAAYSGTLRDGKRIISPGLTEFLSGVCNELHIDIARIPMSEVPKDSESFKHWVYDRFRRKDKLMSRFYSDDLSIQGTLGEKSSPNNLGLKGTLPAVLFWTAVHIPLLGTSFGRHIYWKATVSGIVLGWIVMALS